MRKTNFVIIIVVMMINDSGKYIAETVVKIIK